MSLGDGREPVETVPILTQAVLIVQMADMATCPEDDEPFKQDEDSGIEGGMFRDFNVSLHIHYDCGKKIEELFCLTNFKSAAEATSAIKAAPWMEGPEDPGVQVDWVAGSGKRARNVDFGLAISHIMVPAPGPPSHRSNAYMCRISACTLKAWWQSRH